METILDSFQRKLALNYIEFTLATSCAKAGLELISDSPKNSEVSLYLGNGVHTEPVRFSELLPVSGDFISSTIALYQNMMIAAWNDLLHDIFNHYLSLHFKNEIILSELKKQDVKLDFSSSACIESQVQSHLQNNFSFKGYKDRVKLISGIIKCKKNISVELSVIEKHVHIRNAVQHHNGLAYPDMFKMLGVSFFTIMDGDGKDKPIHLGDKIFISVPEFDYLKRCLQLVTQYWRNNNA
ncbi:MAG: hypothetical protein ACRC52_11165 [Aeromonas veronii]